MHYKRFTLFYIIFLIIPLLFTSCFLQPIDEPADDAVVDGDTNTTNAAIDSETEAVDTQAILSEIETYSDRYPLREIAPKLQVADESNNNPQVQLLVLKLKEAVATKDVDGLLSLVSDDIRYNASGETGKSGFTSMWNLDTNPEDSELWAVLEELFPFGGTFQGDNLYIMPYMAAVLSVDYNAVITNDIVNLREDPSTDSNILERLNYDYVNLIEYSDESYSIDGKDYSWVKIKSSAGTVGYVVAKYIYLQDNYRIFITYENNEWQITSIVPGK
jgi:hypothetical protein